VGDTIRVQVTASNLAGSSAPTSSAATGVVVSKSWVPVLVWPPIISGITTVGQVLSTSTGSWSGTPPISYAYQWQLKQLAPTGKAARIATILKLGSYAYSFKALIAGSVTLD
jgi:hypothetical protein